MRGLPIVTSVLLTAACAALPAAAQAPADALQRCRALVDAAARLACYDAIPLGGAAAAAPAAATPAGPARTPPVGAAPVAAAAPVPGPSPGAPGVPAAAANPPDRVAAFGLPDPARAAEPEFIESQVGRDFSGWGPNERIRLDNGQVWQVTDGSSGDVRPSQRKVKVRRGVLGSYFLEFEGMNRSPRVRRVQ